VTVLAITLPTATAAAQVDSRLRAERSRLDSLRRERQLLQQRMYQLQSDVHDLSEEVTNLDRQADVTERLVRSLDAQLTAINKEVSSTTADLVRAEDELEVKRATLQRRLVDIYKRGPLYSVEVLLSANTFGDLMARYKYLHLLALRDRQLVHRVEDLRNQIRRQRGNLVHFQRDIEENRSEKADEEQRLRDLQKEQQLALARTQRRAHQVEDRLKELARDEGRLSGVIANLEAARLRAERAGPATPKAPSALRSAEARLDWPVDGRILYSYGRVVNPNGGTTRWNGIGISAGTGTPVKSVAAGRVVVAEAFGTYGPTVIVQHSGGDYSVYGSLADIAVSKGQAVSRGQTLGTVGSADPDLPPHLHFEISPQGRAADPMDWLKEK